MKNYIFGIVFLAGMILFSCADQLEITPPNTLQTNK